MLILSVAHSDLQCRSSHKQLLFGVDWAPMLPGDEYAEANQCRPFNNQSASCIPHAIRPRSHHFYQRFWTSLTTWGCPQVGRQHCTSDSSKKCIALQPGLPASPVLSGLWWKPWVFLALHVFQPAQGQRGQVCQVDLGRDRHVESCRTVEKLRIDWWYQLVNLIIFYLLMKKYWSTTNSCNFLYTSFPISVPIFKLLTTSVVLCYHRCEALQPGSALWKVSSQWAQRSWWHWQIIQLM